MKAPPSTKKCFRCQRLVPVEEFDYPNSHYTHGKSRQCRECRGRAAQSNLTQCAGWEPGKKSRCKKMLANYRCEKCWKRVREGDPHNNYTAEDLGCSINTKGY